MYVATDNQMNCNPFPFLNQATKPPFYFFFLSQHGGRSTHLGALCPSSNVLADSSSCSSPSTRWILLSAHTVLSNLSLFLSLSLCPFFGGGSVHLSLWFTLSLFSLMIPLSFFRRASREMEEGEEYKMSKVWRPSWLYNSTKMYKDVNKYVHKFKDHTNNAT